MSCGRDNEVTLWNADGNKAKGFDFFGEMPLRAALAHDGARVIAIDFNGRAAAWTSADGKQVAELDTNPRPLAEQIAALEKKLHDSRRVGDKPVPEVVAAEAKVAEANAELEKANKAVEQAKAEQTAKEAEVERWKVEAAKADPPADIQARLADAREVRGKARAAFTNATQTVKAKSSAVESAKAAVTELKKQDPQELIASAEARFAKLKSARGGQPVPNARDGRGAQARSRSTSSGHRREEGGTDAPGQRNSRPPTRARSQS